MPDHEPSTALSDTGAGAGVATVLRWLAACAGVAIDTAALEEALRGDPPGEPGPALSAVVRVPGGTQGDLGDLLTCLAAQDIDPADLEIVVATPDPGSAGRALGAFAAGFAERCRIVDAPGQVTDAGLAAAEGTYLSVVEPGQLLTADWARRFVEGARRHTGRVIRAQGFLRLTLAGPGGAPMTATRTTPAAPMPFELGRQLRHNQMGPGTFALPRSICRPGGVWYGEAGGDVADWAFATQAAMVAGVADIDHRTVITTRPASEPFRAPSASDLAAALAATPLIAAPDAARTVLRRLATDAPEAATAVALQMDALVGQVRMLQDQAADLYAEMERLRSALTATEADRGSARAAYEEIRDSELWRATAPVRASIDLARKGRRQISRLARPSRSDPPQ